MMSVIVIPTQGEAANIRAVLDALVRTVADLSHPGERSDAVA